MKIWILAILLFCSFVAALLSGAAGFGGSLLLLPVVTACVGSGAAVPLLTIAQLIGNLSRMAVGMKQIDWKSVGWFSLTSLPLAALGAFGLSLLSKDLVTRSIGAALILLVLMKLLTKKNLPNGKGTLLAGGAVTGGVSGLCGSGGPIGAAVFLSLGLSPVAYIASEAATATAMHILKTIIYSHLTGITVKTLLIGVAMVLPTDFLKRWTKTPFKNMWQCSCVQSESIWPSPARRVWGSKRIIAAKTLRMELEKRE